jgi:PGF-pre-PGF domain-containing protein
MLVLPALALAQVPPLPAFYYGNLTVIGPGGVTIDGPVGTVVAAWVGGQERGRIVVTEAGKYGGPEGPDPKLLVQDDIPDGSLIEFYVNGVKANQTDNFESGAIKRLDLTVNDNAPPIIENLRPSDNAVVDTATPEIGADYYDVLSGIDVGSVVIKLDNVNVTAGATVTASSVSYIPPAPLAAGWHEVEVTVEDGVGISATRTWSFRVPSARLEVRTSPIRGEVFVDGVSWGLAPQAKLVDPGTYTVSFGAVAGWVTPPAQTVTLATGENKIAVGNYHFLPEQTEAEDTDYADEITPEVPVTLTFEDVAITQITIHTKQTVQDVSVTVEQSLEPPLGGLAVGAPPVLYRYLKIVYENILDEDVDYIIIEFRVPKSWMAANGIGENTIALHRYDPITGTWTSLPTTKIGEDATYVYYQATSPGLSVFAITGKIVVIVVEEAEFRVSDLEISPLVVRAGEPVDISATVTNITDVDGDYVVVLKINGEVEDTESVTLEGGMSTRVTFVVVREEPGTYDVEVDGLYGSFTVTAVAAPPPPPLVPWWLLILFAVIAMLIILAIYIEKKRPRFRVRDLRISPGTVRPRKPVTVSARVENVGDVRGTHELKLKVKGRVVQTQSVRLGPGESTRVSFTVIEEIEGDYDIELNGLVGGFTVAAAVGRPLKRRP